MMPARRLDPALRVLAATIGVASIGLLNSATAVGDGVIPPSNVFFLVFSAGAAFIVLAGGLGAAVAAALGAVMALSISIAMANVPGLMLVEFVQFSLLTMIIFVVVGRIAGNADNLPKAIRPRGAEPPKNVSRLVLDGASPVWRPSAVANPQALDAVIGGLARDFCIWSDTGILARAASPTQTWSAYARFVRQALIERLGASGVRVFLVDPAGTELTPLAQHHGQPVAPLAADGPVAVAIQTAAAVTRRDGTPRWVLPLQDHGATRAIVTIIELEQPSLDEPHVAHAVADILQLFWRHIRGMQTLESAASEHERLHPAASPAESLQ